jgi:hypothetical protein
MTHGTVLKVITADGIGTAGFQDSAIKVGIKY